ncbi:MAG TPA: GlsB/YeaQ/YmgE family stress response membrane protein [Chloroflexota bacterium]|nr:GlsB/YeaQ/YmgE family stress response membrane protein [Chloroflexota bacterium]
MALIILIVMIVLGIIALIGLISLIGNVIGVILTVLFAGLIGWAADAIIPGRVPFGFLGAILAGLFGSWLGVALFGAIGPTIFHIPVISAFIGAVIIALVFSLLITPLSHRRAA